MVSALKNNPASSRLNESRSRSAEGSKPASKTTSSKKTAVEQQQDLQDKVVLQNAPSTQVREFAQTSKGHANDGVNAAQLAQSRGVDLSPEIRTQGVNAVGQPKSPAQPEYDPGYDAKELYESMHGGMFGAGTDEERLLKALDGKTPQQIDALKSEYQDHYGRNLDADVKSELGGSDLRQAESLLEGDQAASDATALHQAMKGGTGIGTNESQIFETLEGKSAGEIEEIKQAYQDQTGNSLENHLKGELGGAELYRAQGLLNGDTAATDAAKLNEAMKGGLTGAGTDEAAVFTALEDKSPQEREAIIKAYDEQYGDGRTGTLQNHISEEFSGVQADRANALLKGDAAVAEAAKIEQAANGGFLGIGTNEDAINSAFEGKTAQERADIETAYNSKYGDLRHELKDELGTNELGKTTALLERGELTGAEKIYYASAGVGTDEDTIQQTLAGKSKEEVAQLRKNYQQQFGKSLGQTLQGEMGGRDLFDAQMSLKGRPENAHEALEQANERYDFERSGPLNVVSNSVMNTFTDKGELLDRNNARANAAYESAMEKGFMTLDEQARVEKLTGFSNMDVNTYREAKDSMADTAGTVAATAASVAVVVGTAGTATPLAVGLMAGVAGAGARVTTSGLISGKGYSSGDALKDAGVGAVDGAFTVAGAGAGNAVAKTVVGSMSRKTLARAGVKNASAELTELTGKELLERSVVKRTLAGATQGGTDGLIGGAAGGAALAGFDDKTWDDGVAKGLERVAKSSAMGAGLGLGAGGLIGGGMGTVRKDLGIIDENKILHRSQNGKNHWQTVGRYNDMLTVNKAVERTPRQVSIKGPQGAQQVKVYGAANAAEAARIQGALDKAAKLPGAKMPTEVHVRSHIGDITDSAHKPTGNIGGLGGDGQRVMIARNALGDDNNAAHVIHHEMGHNIDTRLGPGYKRLTDTKGSHLFGKGKSVSDYAAKNAAEDFAETHRVVVQHYDRILKDPDRYLRGDIGKKIDFIMQEVYGVNPRTGAKVKPSKPGMGGAPAKPGPIMPSNEGPSFLQTARLESDFKDVARRLGAAERKLEIQEGQLATIEEKFQGIPNRGYDDASHHDVTSPDFRGGGSMTTPLPRDAAEVFERSRPDPTRPKGDSWWGRSESGDWYRYQGSVGKPVHWNGATGTTGADRAMRLADVPSDIRTHNRLSDSMGDQQAKVSRLQTEFTDAEFARDFARLEFSEAVEGVTKNPALREMNYSELLKAARSGEHPHAVEAQELLAKLGVGLD